MFLVCNLALIGQEVALEQFAYFSGEEITITTKFEKRVFGRTGELGWQLNSKGSVLGKGKINREDQKVTFKVNELRPGMSIQANLRFSGHGRQRATNLFFFSQDPFSELKILEKTRIGVYPENSPLTQLFEHYKLHHLKLNSLKDYEGQIIYVTGADFTTTPELTDALLNLAIKGVRVIVVAPFKGTFKIKDNDFQRIISYPPQGIKSFRRDFDIPPLASGIASASDGQGLTLQFQENGGGFGAVFVTIGRGSIVFSGWSVENAANPTSIYLLRQYLLMDIR